jgi:hypothetical protein
MNLEAQAHLDSAPRGAAFRRLPYPNIVANPLAHRLDNDEAASTPRSDLLAIGGSVALEAQRAFHRC